MSQELIAEDLPLTRSQSTAGSRCWPISVVEAAWERRVLAPLNIDKAQREHVMMVVRYAYPPPGLFDLELAAAMFCADYQSESGIDMTAVSSAWRKTDLPQECISTKVAYGAFYTLKCLYQASGDGHGWFFARKIVSSLLAAHRNASDRAITASQTYTHLLALRKALLDFAPYVSCEQGDALDEITLKDGIIKHPSEAIEREGSRYFDHGPARQAVEILAGDRILGSVDTKRKTAVSQVDADEPELPEDLVRTAAPENDSEIRSRHQARPEAVVSRTTGEQFWPRPETLSSEVDPSDSRYPVPSAATQKQIQQLARWDVQDDNVLADDPEQMEQLIEALPAEQRQPARTRARKKRPLQRLRGSTDVHRLKSRSIRALLHSAQSSQELVFMTLVYLGRPPKEVERLTIVEQFDPAQRLTAITYDRSRGWLWMPIEGGARDWRCFVLISGVLEQALAACRSTGQPLQGLTKIIDQRGRSKALKQLGGVTVTAQRLRAAGWLTLRPIAGDDMITEALSGQLRAATATDMAYRRIANSALQDAFDAFIQQLGLMPRQSPQLFELTDEHVSDNIGSQSEFDLNDAFELVEQLRNSTDSLLGAVRWSSHKGSNRAIADFINRNTALLYLLLALCTASRPWGEETENSLHGDGQWRFILHSEKASKKHTERRWLPLPPWLSEWLESWQQWVEAWGRRQARTGWHWHVPAAVPTVLPGRVRLVENRAEIRLSSFTHEDFRKELEALMSDSPSWRAYKDKARGNALRHLVSVEAQSELGHTAQHWLLGHIRETDANLHWVSSRSIWADERDIRRLQKKLLAAICPLDLALPDIEEMRLRGGRHG